MAEGGCLTVYGKNFRFSWWSGQALVQGLLAIDLRLSERLPYGLPCRVPQLTNPHSTQPKSKAPKLHTTEKKAKLSNILFAAASTADEHVLVKREDLPRFIYLHRQCVFVMYRAALQWHVIDALLESQSLTEVRAAWWEVPNEGCAVPPRLAAHTPLRRLRDVLILHQLLRLAQADEQPVMSDFVNIVRLQTSVELDPVSRYATRWAEVLQLPLGALEEGLQSAAVREAIVCVFVYEKMVETALELMDKHATEMMPDALRRYGPLTEVIQVKGEIALQAITRRGMHVDLSAALRLRKILQEELDVCAQKVAELRDFNPFSVWRSGARAGQMKRTKNHKPMMKQERLEELLLKAADDVYTRTGTEVNVPTTPDGCVSLSSKRWAPYAALHPFIAHWCELETVARLHNFVAGLDAALVHPVYTLLVRNGRTSCAAPNIQQCPRKAGYRDLLLPAPGHVLLACDYSFIELCTLAAVCEHRYGASQLARVIREGVDPHCFTAAMFEKLSLAEFMAMKTSPDPDVRSRFDQLRQRAKAINFGIPGGQGAAALVEYALNSYGVTLSLADARQFRNRLINEVYPELSHYLFEDRRFVDQLALRLAVPVSDVWQALKELAPAEQAGRVAHDVRSVIAGDTQADGRPYPEEYKERVWEALRALNKNDSMTTMLAGVADGNEELENKLFGADVTTLTGRIRGGVGFTQACNTAFSGLAADGAKLAMWDLLHIGFRLVAFVHDEVVIELPLAANYTHPARVAADVMCRAMQEVCGSIPVAVKFTVATNWTRNAIEVRDAHGQLQPWYPSNKAP